MWWTGSPARPEKRFLAGRYLLQTILCKRGSNGDPSDDGSEAPQAGRRCFSRRADELHKRGLSGCILPWPSTQPRRGFRGGGALLDRDEDAGEPSAGPPGARVDPVVALRWE